MNTAPIAILEQCLKFQRFICHATICSTYVDTGRVIYIIIYLYFSISIYRTEDLWFISIQFSIMFAFIGITLIISSQLTGKLVDYMDSQQLLRIMTAIQIIGVILVSLILINHLNFWLLAIGFIILVAPVTGVATLGFSIAMDESKSGKGVHLVY